MTLSPWLARKDESAFINDRGREAVNYKISMRFYKSLAGLLVLLIVGCFILPAPIVLDIVVVIMGAVAANAGRYCGYPIAIRFIPSWPRRARRGARGGRGPHTPLSGIATGGRRGPAPAAKDVSAPEASLRDRVRRLPALILRQALPQDTRRR